MNAQLKSYPKPALPVAAPSAVTCSLVDQLVQRDALGLRRYGVSLDRKDLTISEWLQHGVEEALDMAGYMTSAMREIQSLEDELVKTREQLAQAQHAAREYALLRRDLEQLLRSGDLPNRYNPGQNYQAGYRDMYGRICEVMRQHDMDSTLRQLRRT